jgi:hypothetical protein
MEEDKKKKGKEKDGSEDDDDLHSGLDSFKTVSNLHGIVAVVADDGDLQFYSGPTLRRGHKDLPTRSDLSIFRGED